LIENKILKEERKKPFGHSTKANAIKNRKGNWDAWYLKETEALSVGK